MNRLLKKEIVESAVVGFVVAVTFSVLGLPVLWAIPVTAGVIVAVG